MNTIVYNYRIVLVTKS